MAVDTGRLLLAWLMARLKTLLFFERNGMYYAPRDAKATPVRTRLLVPTVWAAYSQSIHKAILLRDYSE